MYQPDVLRGSAWRGWEWERGRFETALTPLRNNKRIKQKSLPHLALISLLCFCPSSPEKLTVPARPSCDCGVDGGGEEVKLRTWRGWRAMQGKRVLCIRSYGWRILHATHALQRSFLFPNSHLALCGNLFVFSLSLLLPLPLPCIFNWILSHPTTSHCQTQKVSAFCFWVLVFQIHPSQHGISIFYTSQALVHLWSHVTLLMCWLCSLSFFLLSTF